MTALDFFRIVFSTGWGLILGVFFLGVCIFGVLELWVELK